ncbi:MAG: Serine hydroxymethyltransferase [Parcubacteria group bacterium GW2011_GWA1_49_11]|uniref:GPI inositol-deacylase PGAP1-like alpha/beta domain-containing protein n=1 Tax=Candidatus Yanofskybacteria bacterium RIFCSPHIGHO2_01_FULL_48_25b TaxID=1802672 RepID=A0A1F8F1Q6_9BACT|nr:MAG: Serine hydroxymethyltransferase [Parcubacteria group bacterium GW2011_GWA1_49_11]OGN07055.1 MAG: hypothetical protein A2669_02255 [Candidatus Yanofskybacteria bacterium RIFCSPHIGHO2_01_FULL_48_25b]
MKKSVFALLFVLVAGNICGQTIFVSQPSASRILKINAATGGAEVFYNWGSSPPASGLAMGPDGRLYFNLEYTVSGQVTISRMKQDGSQLENIFATSSLTLINTLFFTGPDLYFVALTVVTENNWHWDIWKIKDLGSIAYGQKFPEPVVFFTGYYCPPFNHGLTLTPSGDLLLFDPMNDQVLKIGPPYTTATVFIEKIGVNSAPNSGLVQELTVKDGELLVANVYGGANIGRFDLTSGQFLGYLTSFSADDSLLMMAPGPGGDLFVTTSRNNLWRIRNGAKTLVWSRPYPKECCYFIFSVASPEMFASTGAGQVSLIDGNLNAPLGGKTPLILVHGWNPNGIPAGPQSASWDRFVSYFYQDASLRGRFKLYFFNYYSNEISVGLLGSYLGYLTDLGGYYDASFLVSKPVLLAHSMGGLVSRAYMNEYAVQIGPQSGQLGGEKVARLITLAAPHHGSPMANGNARDSRAGAVYGSALTTFDVLFYAVGPGFTQKNRTDLRWDNYDGLFNYSSYSGERNTWLENLNASTAYDSKITAYGGVTNRASDCVVSDPLCWGSIVMRNGIGLENDGVVPLGSSLFANPDGTARTRGRLFFNYNHDDMIAGQGDNLLFDQIKKDLLAAAPASLSRTRSLLSRVRF